MLFACQFRESEKHLEAADLIWIQLRTTFISENKFMLKSNVGISAGLINY
jgi:hypothetical protein